MSSDSIKETVTEQPKSKTPEELSDERAERFNKDPESFIEISEMIACTLRSPNGVMIYINGSKEELATSWCELNRKIMGIMNKMDLEAEMRKQAAQKIVRPGGNGGIMNFARRKNK